MRALAILAALAVSPAQAQTLPERLGCGDARFVETGFSLPRAAEALQGGVLVILVIGSSSTAGTGAGGPRAAYPARTEALLRETFGAERIEVIARGVGGERAAGAFERMPGALARTGAQLVVWQVGTNDALRKLAPEAVAGTIRDGIGHARGTGADIILVDPQFFPRIANSTGYAATARMVDDVGRDSGISVVDRYERMASASADDLDALLARDKLHMSADGHECLAQDLARAIRDGLKEE